jgi:hypothetical protein
MMPLLIRHRTLCHTLRLIKLGLGWIAENQIPHHPNRIEPRRRKRRPEQ